MRELFVFLAALAAAGGTSAQVAVFGVVDTNITYIQTRSSFVGIPGTPSLNYVGAPDVKQSQWSLGGSGYQASRLGFRGTEDLGGGLAAAFWLEAAMGSDDGTVATAGFDRRSTVSLLSSVGEVRLGRDYVPTFWNDDIFDPFGTNGVGQSLIFQANNGPRTVNFGGTNRYLFGNGTATRASNSIGYFLPSGLGGFYGQAMYAFSEAVSYNPGGTTPAKPVNQRSGGYRGGRLGYANGPLDVAASYGESITGNDYFQGITTKAKTANLGASYDFGVVKVYSEISRTRNDNDYVVPPLIGTGDFNGDGYLLGASVPVGVGLIRVAYSHVKLNYNSPPAGVATIVRLAAQDPSGSRLSIGYVYNLSQRTLLYATTAYTKDENGAAFIFPIGDIHPNFLNNYYTTGSGYKADSAIGYQLGIRHAF